MKTLSLSNFAEMLRSRFAFVSGSLGEAGSSGLAAVARPAGQATHPLKNARAWSEVAEFLSKEAKGLRPDARGTSAQGAALCAAPDGNHGENN